MVNDELIKLEKYDLSFGVELSWSLNLKQNKSFGSRNIPKIYLILRTAINN